MPNLPTPKLSTTFLFQVLTLTFNISYITHIAIGGMSTSIPANWELFLVTALSLSTTWFKAAESQKFAEFTEKEIKDKDKITNIITSNLILSLVADFHFIPAIMILLQATGEVVFPVGILYLCIGALIMNIIATILTVYEEMVVVGVSEA